MECRILFHDSDLRNFDWCKLDDASGKIIDSGTSSADELTGVCSDSAKTLVFFPQQDILITSPQLPPKASKQQLNSIAYTVEELLAEDIDDCFFAISAQQADHSVPVAVINREVMDNWMQLLSRKHINARLILPSIYLCPWSDADDLLATICPVEGGYLVRTGQHEGLFCQQAILSQVVALLEKNKSAVQSRIVMYGEGILNDFEAADLLLEQKESIKLLARSFDTKSCINLKQKNYQSSHQWLGLLKRWRWPMAAMLILVLVVIASNLLDGWQKEQIYNDIISQQKTLLNQHLPDLVAGDQPKTQLIKVLADSQGSDGQTGFLDLLHEYSRLKAGFNAVITNKIVYQQSSLIVNLETKDLNSLESFRAGLEKSSFQAQIENVNINPDKTTGRLVMRDTQ